MIFRTENASGVAVFFRNKGEAMISDVFSKIGAILLSGFLLIGSVAPLHAFDKCEHRIRKAELRLEKAIRKHGVHSIQAERQREQLERVRERCHRRY